VQQHGEQIDLPIGGGALDGREAVVIFPGSPMEPFTTSSSPNTVLDPPIPAALL
jgi:hypothetical protein